MVVFGSAHLPVTQRAFSCLWRPHVNGWAIFSTKTNAGTMLGLIEIFQVKEGKVHSMNLSFGMEIQRVAQQVLALSFAEL